MSLVKQHPPQISLLAEASGRIIGIQGQCALLSLPEACPGILLGEWLPISDHWLEDLQQNGQLSQSSVYPHGLLEIRLAKVANHITGHIWLETPFQPADGAQPAERLLGFYHYDAEREEVDAGPGFAELMGIDPSQEHASLAQMLSKIHPDDRQAFTQYLKGQSENSKKPFTIMVRRIDSQGEAMPLQFGSYREGSRQLGLVQLAAEPEEMADRYKLLLQQSPLPILIHDLSGNILMTNPATVRIMGVAKAEELLGKNLMEFMHPKDHQPIRERLKALLTQGSQDALEHQVFRQDGQVIDIEVMGSLTRYANQPAVQVVLKDITDQKKNLEAIRQSEENYRSILNTFKEGVATCDSKGTILYKNFAFDQMLDIPQHHRELTHLSQIRNLIDDQYNPISLDAFILSKEEDLRNARIGQSSLGNASNWLILNTTRIHHADGQLARVILSLLDVTEETAIEQHYRRLSLVARRISDGVIILNRLGRIEWVNAGFTELTGFTLPEVQFKDISEVMHGPETSESMSRKMWEKLRLGFGIREEMCYYKKDGTPLWLKINTQPLLNDHGEVESYVSIQTDITDWKNYELLIKQRNRDLRKINQELDSFVYRVSHDLRAPLASAIGLIALTEKEKDEEQLRKLLKLQKTSLLKLDNFITDILQFSRNARLPIEKTEINIHELVESVFEKFVNLENSQVCKKIIRVEQDMTFESDAKRLDIILSNLISNALRYLMPHYRGREPEVEVRASVDSREATIAVSDNGEGIPEGHKEKVFEMFYRASPNRTGSGLGLYIVKEAIEKLSGNISLETQLNEGSTFTITIPNLHQKSLV